MQRGKKCFQIFFILKRFIARSRSYEQLSILVVDDLFDLQAIRIICNDINECYTILGHIHNKYSPVPGRFKDYIAVKKPNLYQSIHTAVIGVDGKIFEVQIRTHEMDEIAENGIAAHWKYKENGSVIVKRNDIEEQLHFFKDIILEHKNDEDEIKSLKEEIFEANIYTLTPNKKIITLPKHSTVVDFAFRVHSKVAEEMIGATVNGKVAQFSQKLNNGDIVEIKTRKGISAVKEEWLDFVKTEHAVKKIKQFVKRKKNEIYEEEINKGKEILEFSIKKKEIDFDFDDQKATNKLLRKFSCKRMVDFYIALATKKVSIEDIKGVLDEKVEKNIKTYKTAWDVFFDFKLSG